MKRIAVIIGLLLILGVTCSQAQRSYTLTYPVSYYSLPYRAADTVSRNDTVWDFQVLLTNFDWPVKSQWEMRLDEVSGAGATDISLQGKMFSADSWTNISTVNYASGGSDTTFTISDATARAYRYFRIYLDKAAGTGVLEVERMQVKFYQTQ